MPTSYKTSDWSLCQTNLKKIRLGPLGGWWGKEKENWNEEDTEKENPLESELKALRKSQKKKEKQVKQPGRR